MTIREADILVNDLNEIALGNKKFSTQLDVKSNEIYILCENDDDNCTYEWHHINRATLRCMKCVAKEDTNETN